MTRLPFWETLLEHVYICVYIYIRIHTSSICIWYIYIYTLCIYIYIYALYIYIYIHNIYLLFGRAAGLKRPRVDQRRDPASLLGHRRRSKHDVEVPGISMKGASEVEFRRE